MILISHRGNTNGKDESNENKLDYIKNAINLSYNVEIDIHNYKNKLYLGHDEPLYEININELLIYKNKLWIHCKDYESIIYFNNIKEKFNYFWHQSDDCVLTSKNYIWAFPGKKIKNSIAVMPEIYNDDINKRIGICSDFIINYNKILL